MKIHAQSVPIFGSRLHETERFPTEPIKTKEVNEMKQRTKILAGLMSIATLAYVAGWLSGQAGQALV